MRRGGVIVKGFALAAFCLCAASMEASVRNALASFREVGRFLIEGGSTKLATYNVEPQRFSFSETGAVYKVRFCPRRAVPHEVIVSYPKNSGSPRGISPSVTRGMEVEIVLRHADEIESFCVTNCPPILYQDRRFSQGSGREIRHSLFRIRVAEFKWFYKDPIELEIRLRTPVCAESYLNRIDARIVVSEDFAMR